MGLGVPPEYQLESQSAHFRTPAPEVEPNAKFHRREREAGKFSRMIGLPDNIDPDAVDAALENGILTVVIPKKEAAKPRQITIK